MSVLVLVAHPEDPALDDTLARRIEAETGGELNWLNQRIACEITHPKSSDPLGDARALIGARPIDAAHVPLSNRRKKLLIADMDSTMINEECVDELGDALGIKERIAAITERAMRGEIDFIGALKERVGLLKGIERAVMEEIRREKITYASGGRALVQTMKAYGARTVLVSGGFTFFADHIGKRIGFDAVAANTLEFDGDSLSGTVSEPIVDSSTKLARLETEIEQLGIPRAATLAVGDGANDLPMIKAAGMGVALHAKPAVAESAEVRIDHADLTALLYLQGYEESEIVR
ncbi:phosphoserine phosphatase SerB [Cucumibacter marinus]|uniref:phosphoserine phosphatase SerB n=1 Tax=Cucumibacter marinus TaxID=1121252 RepID=UPI0004064B54|nr:phosphoserine phosphatase SerB [Cucumibacter marinus]